ncbi:hypothetical protein QO034_01660 [Sedimentitalea sp. JM2-8]|uniref:MetA-pathway of phenol degradation n=1 Tax=Sedimentitalea xiamensis TaxID=3050037 RepID=A0ABT7F9M4_9RHOB|nr:hypothetical protein [Sedimentitalea xiamensis]MDK3071806.1 hypothetical protein [Sedimentitalea xiamensis]
MTRFRSIWASLSMIICLAAASADAQDNSAAQANNPLAQTTSVNFQNFYVGDLTGLDTDANQFYFRAAVPFQAFGGDWIMRATLPVNTLPTGPSLSHDTGIGDFNVFAAYLFDTGNPAISFGIGPQLTAPTATNSDLGSEKWSAGLANVMFNATSPKVQWGYLLTWQASFAGPDSAPDVNAGAFQPFLFYQLGQGWYLRSTAIWTYNFENDAYMIPLGFGAGKVTKTDRAVINTFIEPQYTLDSRGTGMPEWSVFAGINFQF